VPFFLAQVLPPSDRRATVFRPLLPFRRATSFGRYSAFFSRRLEVAFSGGARKPWGVLFFAGSEAHQFPPLSHRGSSRPLLLFLSLSFPFFLLTGDRFMASPTFLFSLFHALIPWLPRFSPKKKALGQSPPSMVVLLSFSRDRVVLT